MIAGVPTANSVAAAASERECLLSRCLLAAGSPLGVQVTKPIHDYSTAVQLQREGKGREEPRVHQRVRAGLPLGTSAGGYAGGDDGRIGAFGAEVVWWRSGGGAAPAAAAPRRR